MFKLVARTGWALDAVLDLDVDTFNDMVEASLRVEYMDKIEHAWTLMVAAQGKDSDMKKWTKRWKDVIYGKDGAASDPTVGNLNDFIKAFGSGF